MINKNRRPPYPQRKTCNCKELGTGSEPEWSWQGIDDIWMCLGCGMVLDRLDKLIKPKQSKKEAKTARKLELKDFENPLFHTRVKQRRINLAVIDGKVRTTTGRSQMAFEGTTYTDQYVLVGFTYLLEDEVLSVVNKDNQQLFFGKIKTAEDFEEALKRADKKEKSLW